MITSFAKGLLGLVTVEQKDQTVIVEGINAGRLAYDIQKEWNTSRIFGSLFQSVGSRRFSVSAFYLPEMMYIIEKLLDKKRVTSSRSGLNSLLMGLKYNTWWKEVGDRVENPPPTRLDTSQLNKFIHKPLEYNERFFKRYEFETNVMGKRGALCAGAPGSGKTYMTLAVAEMLHAPYVIIVCPKNTLEKPWRQAMEAEDLYKKPQEYWIVADGQPYKKQRFLIGHYEALGELIKAASTLPKGKAVIILDESHHFNELTAKRTQQFITLCETTQSQDIIWSSGTPIKKMGYEVIPYLITTDPLFSKNDIESFKKTFGRDGTRGADILKNRMQRVMTVVTKDEMERPKPKIEYIKVQVKNAKMFTLDHIRDDMRKFIEERVKYYKGIENIIEKDYTAGVELYKKSPTYDKRLLAEYQSVIRTLRKASDYRMLGKEMRFSNRFEKDHIIPALSKEDAKRFIDAKSAYKYLILKIQGECLGRVVGKAREQSSVAIAEAFDFEEYINNSESKTVIFSSWVNAVEKTYEILNRSKEFKPLFFYAKNSGNIAQVLKDFTNKPEQNPLITTFKSLSTGVPLLAASTEILIDAPFRPYILDQTISRVDRLGQAFPVKVYICQLDTGGLPNISTRNKDILSWAQEQVEAITGVASSYEVSDAATGSVESFTDWEYEEALEAFDALSDYPPHESAKDLSYYASLKW